MTVEARAAMLREADYMYTMCIARKRYREETKDARAFGFRAWARKTYNPKGATGKLKRLVAP